MATYAQLQKGATGEDVKKLQNYLNNSGYGLTVDGVWGDKTDAAVRDYQTKNNLTVDGIVGKNTWASLLGNSYNTNPPTSSKIEAPSFSYDDYEAPDPFDFGKYEESDSVKDAGNKKTESENALSGYGDFNYSNQQSLDDIINKILNREQFSYDLNGDALYQQYKDKYIQQGKMAMQDTMGQASAMTGGYGNSYAATAGNQAYQAHLENLNDIVPELYQMAYDRYNQEGQDMLNKYSMLSDDRSTQYGEWTDGYNRLATDRDYYANQYDSERNYDYGKYADDRDFSYGQYSDDRNFGYNQWADGYNIAYGEHRDAIADQQWQANFDEAQRQYEENMAFQREQYEYQKEQASKAASSGGSSGGSGSGGSGSGGSSTMWYATGTYDDDGNPVFRNSEGKTQAFGEGINPYTGTKHKDAKYGTFSNGYQPNNIGGTKLVNSGMSTSVTGKEQTIWEANGKYWLWRGDLNKYIEVDISDLD